MGWRLRNYLLSHSKALEAEYEFIAEQVSNVTNGAVKISKLQAAAIDRTRNQEAWEYLLVNGIPMQEHYHFNSWRKRANEVVPLNKAAQRRLGYQVSQIRLDELIRYIKYIPIK